MRKRWVALLLSLVLVCNFPFFPAEADSKWGDANGDGRFSALDAVTVLRYAMGDELALTAIADVDNNGDVTVADVVLLLRGLIKPTLYVKGFTLDFDAETDYYLCYPADFSVCTIEKYNGFISGSVRVEQYAGYCPYESARYTLGEPLKLGHGRARLTFTGTLPDGTTREYTISLTDPNTQGYEGVMARVMSGTTLREAPRSGSAALASLKAGDRVYYLKTEGNWCLVEQQNTGKVGYAQKSAVKRGWYETKMPEEYAKPIAALKARHPNWSFTFLDVEMTREQAEAKYGAGSGWYLNPANYLNEALIYAMLDVSAYSETKWTEIGVGSLWLRTTAISKEDAVRYFTDAAKALKINPYYVTCRAALESGYGTSRFARGEVSGYEGYYNFYGIRCYDSNPTLGAAYAKERGWNTVFRSIVEGANWIKNQYIDQGAVTPYFFRFAGFQNKEYMTDMAAPMKEAAMLQRALFTSPEPLHFIIPVYR